MIKGKTIISLHDDKIQYLTLAKNEYGFYVENYDSAELSDGIIKNGEILKAEFLSKILSKIQKKINTKHMQLILPHSYFLFDLHNIKDKKEKIKNKKRFIKKYLKENINKLSWVTTHSYEYDFFEKGKKVSILFRALQQDMYRSYEHVFKKAGFSIDSIHSELVSYSDFFKKEKKVTQIFVDNKSTYVLSYSDGVFMSEKKFNFSYNVCFDNIRKNTKGSEEYVKKILEKYGVLKTHDKEVLRSIEKSMMPVFSYLKKKNIKDENVFVHFRNQPIKGFSDRLRKLLKSDVYDLCVLCSAKYTFQDVLSIHKRDSYEYEPLIARALSIFNVK
jgi:Tfp pilus assembly PilM family ATPase